MASPFPGMDPFIEACGLWEDFHTKLIAEIDRALAPVLPDRYVVRAGERSYVVLASLPAGRKHSMVPDIAVVERPPSGRRKKRTAGTAVAERPRLAQKPEMMRALVEDEFRETFLEIRELVPRRRLVTTIEVLTPSNKREGSPGWVQYVRKRQAHLAGYANLVEIDLLRRGQRMPMADDWPDSPYYLLVARKEEFSRCQVWPAHFMQPLPEIPVPLAPPDRDVSLALQPLINAVYARSRYHQDIDYRQSLRPPPSAGEAASAPNALKFCARVFSLLFLRGFRTSSIAKERTGGTAVSVKKAESSSTTFATRGQGIGWLSGHSDRMTNCRESHRRITSP